MYHEIIHKRDDRSRVRIRVGFDDLGNKVKYSIDVCLCEAGKRKFIDPVDFNDYRRRKLSLEDRIHWDMGQYLKYVTAEEIQAAKLELWEKLKP